MEILDLKDNKKYLKEVMELEYLEWAENPDIDKESRIEKKIKKYFEYENNNHFCKLILIENNELLGFISIFPYDSKEEKNLTPWYSTMYVKKEYRGKGYSRLLNDAILKEAKNRGIKTIYLKTELVNYYEKFGAILIKKLDNGESIYKIDLI